MLIVKHSAKKISRTRYLKLAVSLYDSKAPIFKDVGKFKFSLPPGFQFTKKTIKVPRYSNPEIHFEIIIEYTGPEKDFISLFYFDACYSNDKKTLDKYHYEFNTRAPLIPFQEKRRLASACSVNYRKQVKARNDDEYSLPFQRLVIVDEPVIVRTLKKRFLDWLEHPEEADQDMLEFFKVPELRPIFTEHMIPLFCCQGHKRKDHVSRGYISFLIASGRGLVLYNAICRSLINIAVGEEDHYLYNTVLFSQYRTDEVVEALRRVYTNAKPYLPKLQCSEFLTATLRWGNDDFIVHQKATYCVLSTFISEATKMFNLNQKETQYEAIS